MANACRTCELGSDTVHQLEIDYLDGLPISTIAKKYGLKWDSVKYHIEHHLNQKLAIASEQKQNDNSYDLMHRVDELFNRIERIYKRNVKHKDTIALKALSEHRYLLELLAKISFTLNENRQKEIEAKRTEALNIDLPLFKLNRQEQNIYYELIQKLLGNKTGDVDLSAYMVDVDENCIDELESQHLNTPEIPKRIRRKHSTNEDNLSFKPIPQNEPPK